MKAQQINQGKIIKCRGKKRAAKKNDESQQKAKKVQKEKTPRK